MGDLQIKEAPIPECLDDEILIEVGTSSQRRAGTDIRFYRTKPSLSSRWTLPSEKTRI